VDQLVVPDGEYIEIDPYRSTLDGRFNSDQLRVLAYLMDQMRTDEDHPEELLFTWNRSDD
jgi:hypothetical protein